MLCKQFTPDFNEEELHSIRKDSEEINILISELQEFMPCSEIDIGEDGQLVNNMNRSTSVVIQPACIQVSFTHEKWSYGDDDKY